MGILRRFIWRVRNVCRFLPVLWRDQPWDYAYLFALMAAKLEQMEDFYRHGETVSERAQLIASEVRDCRLICERLAGEDDSLLAGGSDQAYLNLLTKRLCAQPLDWWD